MKSNFKSDKPFKKCVNDITEVKCLDRKLYVSEVIGLAMNTNKKAVLCERTRENAYKSHPAVFAL